jgi:UDP-N-acetylglucosamine acyltransferase
MRGEVESSGPGIHPRAIVDPGAELGEGVRIGPHTMVGPDVRIGNDTSIGGNALIEGRTTIGTGNRIGHCAVIGAEPQDLKYGNEKSAVRIGDHNVIREFVTIHRATGEGEETVVGDGNMIMAYAHIAHNCVIGSEVVLANAVNMGGHVTIEDRAGISGLTVIHQFVRIGTLSYTGGGSRVPMDVVPFIRLAGNPPVVSGLNNVGLQRNGVSPESIKVLKQAYRLLFRSDLNVSQAVERLKSDLPQTPEVKHLVEFIQSSERGVRL